MVDKGKKNQKVIIIPWKEIQPSRGFEIYRYEKSELN